VNGEELQINYMPKGLEPMSSNGTKRPCGCLYSDLNCPHQGASIVVVKDSLDDLVEATMVEATLRERGSRYGDFYDNASISQQLKDIAEITPGWNNRLTLLHREGLTMIFQKIARILNGDPNYADNWHDIQGYAKLVEDRLPKEGK